MRLAPIAFVTLMVARVPAARATDRDFREVVREVESVLGTPQVHIPLMGMMKFAAKVSGAIPGRQLDFATFENVAYSPGMEERFRAAIRASLGGSWSPVVQVHAPARREYTGVFVSASHGDGRMLIATLEAHAATIIEVRVSAEEMMKWLNEPDEMAQHQRHSGQDDERDEQ